MQKIATRVFIAASLAFGVLGIAMVLIAPDQDSQRTALDKALMKCFLITIFIILPSFALSVAGRYLNGKK